jgi:hypothetical protein
MSDDPKFIVCPNCGHHASGNYCSQCGQPTHLHKDSFLGLIAHFIGHFHYDSKFFQTLKALWFSPGKLTVAYWNKQRMRYIPPISLYVFISAVYFLAASVLPRGNSYINFNGGNSGETEGIKISKGPGGKTEYSFGVHLDKPAADNEGKQISFNKIVEKAKHHAPKVFFFMIPIMGLILQLLFVRRKELFYVSHIIFALHYHSFWFSIRLLSELYPFKTGLSIVNLCAGLLSAFYFIAALRNVYKISWRRSVFYSMIVGALYSVFILVVYFIVMLIAVRYSQ